MFRAEQLLRWRMCVLRDMKIIKPRGKLSIIATPIGNLSDLTPNIIKGLFQADLIGCEDRRVAGQLYTLIKNRNIIKQMQQVFGSLGFSNVILRENQDEQIHEEETEQKHRFYEYANMSDSQRRKFLGKMTREQQKKFKIDFLKYRAKKIINKEQQFLYQNKAQKFDDLYGIQISDNKHIQSQILKTRAKKGRGLLIPLNTYSQTKMFDLVKTLLQSKHVAIVSDAGMPCISDPGWRMIRMVRQNLPQIPIQVISGPSAIDIMTTLAKSTTNSEFLSGRFQGFASPQISNLTQESVNANKELQMTKQKNFSIHFINSQKLKKNAYILQRIYGEDQKIILANELTKKFERKFHGTLKQLTKYISDQDETYQGIGQMSYLLYKDKELQKEEPKQSEEESNDVNLNVNTFIKALDSTSLTGKQKSELVSSIFGLKSHKAKDLVFEATTAKKRVKKQSDW